MIDAPAIRKPPAQPRGGPASADANRVIGYATIWRMVTGAMEATRVFSAGDRRFTWADVAGAARVWGDWRSLEQQVRATLRADATRAGDGSPTPAEIGEAAREWRYERNLLAAEELQRWLSRWGITVEEWFAYIRHSLLLARGSDVGEAPGVNSGRLSEEIARLTWACAVCSGLLVEWAERLADCVAVERGLRGDGTAAQFTESFGAPDELLRRFSSIHVTDTALGAAIRANTLGLTRLTFRYLVHERIEVLREAALCVTLDGRELDEVARDAGLVTHEMSAYLEDADRSLHTRLLAASPGEVIGPVPIGDGYWLVQVVDRVLPSLEDDAVRERTRRAVFDRAIKSRGRPQHNLA